MKSFVLLVCMAVGLSTAFAEDRTGEMVRFSDGSTAFIDANGDAIHRQGARTDGNPFNEYDHSYDKRTVFDDKGNAYMPANNGDLLRTGGK